MKIMLKLWCAILISVTAVAADSPQQSLQRELLWADGKIPEEIKVGDRLRFKVQDVQLTDQQIKEIQVSGLSTDEGWLVHADSLKVNQQTSEMSFLISPLKSGQRILPEFSFVINEKETLFQTLPLSMNVISSLKGEEKPLDLLPAAKLPFPMEDLLLGIAVILILFIILMYFVYKKLKKQKAVPLPEIKKPELPLDKQVQKLFRKLESLEYIRDSQYKNHYFGVSEILKWFFSKRYLLDAQEATTEELIRLLKTKKVNESHIQEISEFFEELDIIKFTDQKPDEQSAKSLVSRAEKLALSLVKRVAEVSNAV